MEEVELSLTTLPPAAPSPPSPPSPPPPPPSLPNMAQVVQDLRGRVRELEQVMSVVLQLLAQRLAPGQ
jgi:hypothetical protein